MSELEILMNLGLLCSSYLYIIAIILITGKIKDRLPSNFCRKFLHIMIGNFIFIIPFFTLRTFPLCFPFFVASPFILITFLFSPASPVDLSGKFSGLAEVTGGGHKFGLVFYAISYTVLALLFSNNPYVIAAGILPMAYGDAAASLAGQKFGQRVYHIFGTKSVEGSTAMFVTCISGLLTLFLFFSHFYAISISNWTLASACTAAIATASEALTPKGFDNLTVPLLSAVVFLLLMGGL